LGAGAQLGQVTVRVADPADPAAATVVDGRDQVRVHLLATGAPAPAAGQTLVRGRLVYRECISPNVSPLGGSLDMQRCLLVGGAPVFKPVRQARVEVWDQAPFIDVQRAVVDTDDNGEFRAVVPADGTYDVIVVASSVAGQVNLENDAITWFWKPLGLPQRGRDGGTVDFDFAFNKADSLNFNVLDALTRGEEYALDRAGISAADADATFHRAVVIPGGGVAGAYTLGVGNATHTWANSGREVWEDWTMLHEYAHHLEYANGTYSAWGTFHNGCYTSVVAGPACWDRRVPAGGTDTSPDRGCWVNSPELAWFEGFPNYVATNVLDFDAGAPTPAFTRTTGDGLRFPLTAAGGPTCALLGTAHFNHHNQLITGAGVEDHVAGGLLELISSTVPSGSPGLPRRTLEEAVFRIFFRDLRDRMPTVFDFRDQWRTRFPGDTTWGDLMTRFMMF
ncbi:MAG TPA: hypothetical protein VF310_15695, partial [Vicinamibacteria bacterium]